MNIRQWQKYAISMLSNSSSPKRDIEILLSYVIKKERSWLLAFDEYELNKEQIKWLNTLLIRRIKGEPIAYLVGKREFWSLLLHVNKVTMIPRPDTEILVEQALVHLPSIPASILDLGTGTGAIALALATERIDCKVIGCDCIFDAVSLAIENARRLHITNVDFQLSNWFSNLFPKRFELIVSNPPYIDIKDEHLKLGDVRFEPHVALVSEEEGLANLRTIISTAPKWLKSNGWLLLEHGWQQGDAVSTMMSQHGYQSVKTVKDYSGCSRVTLGQFIL